jgi:hypothetical protein
MSPDQNEAERLYAPDQTARRALHFNPKMTIEMKEAQLGTIDPRRRQAGSTGNDEGGGAAQIAVR